MASETVRLRPETHDKLKALAEKSGEPMTTVLDRAVEALRRQQFLDECNEAFTRLKADPKAWAAELKERAELDATLADGLKDG
jgi:predicted transcriptional regulator